MTHAPSGQQLDLRFEDQRASIVEVGGGIRAYRVGERDVLDPYDVGDMCDGAHGAPLIPWPNRLEDGQYGFDGTDLQLALTEPDKHNAIHGLLRWRPWTAAELHDDRVVMTTTLFPQQGYPFALEVRIEYTLGPGGLTIATTATNVGDHPAPYGCGQHPYLSPGRDLIDRCTLRLEAATRIVTDPHRQLPVGTEPVAGTSFDFTEGKVLGSLEIDCAFTDLHRDEDGRAWVQLTGADDRTVQLWVDRSYALIELFTGDTLAPDRRRRGLGAEPMTCPPNAFRTGEHLMRLEPGERTESRWGVTLA